jgi:hypothetical protein
MIRSERVKKKEHRAYINKILISMKSIYKRIRLEEAYVSK